MNLKQIYLFFLYINSILFVLFYFKVVYKVSYNQRKIERKKILKTTIEEQFPALDSHRR